MVIDAVTNTLLGATFVGPQFSELVQAATLAVVAKVPISLLRHAVAPHPTVNQVWDPLLAHGIRTCPLLKTPEVFRRLTRKPNQLPWTIKSFSA